MAHETHQVMAIDGGGTRCRVALVSGDDIYTVETGPANVTTDFDAAIMHIRLGIEKLLPRLDTSITGIPAYIGLAGVTSTEIAARVETAMPFQTVRVTDDRPAAVRAAFGSENGFLAHCGTGSFFASQIEGATRFCGGWGSVLGDEGSAFWVGRQALSQTLRIVDGLKPPSPLSKLILNTFGASSGIVRFASNASPAEIGAHARLVTQYAGNDDPIAHHIMREGANHVATNLRDMGWAPQTKICLTGGIGPEYERFLPADMQTSVRAPEAEPLSGAIALAKDLAKETN